MDISSPTDVLSVGILESLKRNTAKVLNPKSKITNPKYHINLQFSIYNQIPIFNFQ